LTILVDRKTVRALLNWPDVIAAVRGAYRAAAAGDAVPPSSCHVPLAAGAMHLKAGGTIRPALVSVKANLRPDTAAAAGLVLLYDTASWTVQAIIDSADLTAWRTAAAAVVGARALGAAPGAKVAILGAGPLAAATLNAVGYELGARQVHVWSRSREHAAALGPAGTIQVHDTPGAAARSADLVITCTPSREPLISADDVRPDAVICAMGADSPGKRELAADVLAGAVIVTDNMTGAREAGEIAGIPAAAPEVIEEIGDLLTSRRSLPRAGGRRVFDSVGVAHVDTAVTALIAGAAAAAGLGINWEPAAL
jgi:ornithine cyclodeaminase/alanine dehydrogenase-like protein (mu-crystallin family)